MIVDSKMELRITDAVMEHLFDEKSNTPCKRAAATSNDPELGSLALLKAGNK